MDLRILAQNVRRLRTGQSLTQQALADAAGLSLPAIKNLEGAKTEPRMRTVQAIAQALQAELQDLFTPVRELKTVRFRSNKKMRNRENLMADISRKLEDFEYLETVLNDRIPFRLKKIRGQCSRQNPIRAAVLCRKALDLREREPIHDICGLLEHAGIKVFPVGIASEGFFGLSIGEEDGGPAIAVNVYERISVERRIFSAAHELGHLMLHREAYDITLTQENKEEEQEASIFASHFLMPDAGFQNEWNEAAGLHWVERVLKVKRIFHVSYKTVLMRLVDHEDADQSIWKDFPLAYKRRFGSGLTFKEEPEAYDPNEPDRLHKFDFYEDRFSRLTRRAIEEDKISISRGAEILRIRIEEMQDLLNDWRMVL